MSFRTDELLWALLLVPATVGLLVYGFRKRRATSERFGQPATLASLVRGRAPRLRALRGTLIVLGIGLTIVAWAGPQYGSRTRMMQKRGIDVVVALDFSKSMLAQDVRPSRIERAKAELTALLNELTGDRVGLVAFAGETMEFPMTHDYSAVSLFLRDLKPADMPVGGTAIGRALVASKRLLLRSSTPNDTGDDNEPSQRSRVVILITDGEDHEGDPIGAARELGEIGARLFVVAVGSRTGEPIPSYAPDGTWTGYLRDDKGGPILSAFTAESEQQLRQVAAVADGELFRAEEGTVGMDQIRRRMRGMKQQEQKARKVTIAEDRYALVLLPAFLLLLLESLLPDAWYRRRRTQPEATA